MITVMEKAKEEEIETDLTEGQRGYTDLVAEKERKSWKIPLKQWTI